MAGEVKKRGRRRKDSTLLKPIGGMTPEPPKVEIPQKRVMENVITPISDATKKVSETIQPAVAGQVAEQTTVPKVEEPKAPSPYDTEIKTQQDLYDTLAKSKAEGDKADEEMRRKEGRRQAITGIGDFLSAFSNLVTTSRGSEHIPLDVSGNPLRERVERERAERAIKLKDIQRQMDIAEENLRRAKLGKAGAEAEAQARREQAEIDKEVAKIRAEGELAKEEERTKRYLEAAGIRAGTEKEKVQASKEVARIKAENNGRYRGSGTGKNGRIFITYADGKTAEVDSKSYDEMLLGIAPQMVEDFKEQGIEVPSHWKYMDAKDKIDMLKEFSKLSPTHERYVKQLEKASSTQGRPAQQTPKESPFNDFN